MKKIAFFLLGMTFLSPAFGETVSGQVEAIDLIRRTVYLSYTTSRGIRNQERFVWDANLPGADVLERLSIGDKIELEADQAEKSWKVKRVPQVKPVLPVDKLLEPPAEVEYPVSPVSPEASIVAPAEIPAETEIPSPVVEAKPPPEVAAVPSKAPLTGSHPNPTIANVPPSDGVRRRHVRFFAIQNHFKL